MSKVLQLNKKCHTFISPATGNAPGGLVLGGQTVRVSDKNAAYLLQGMENPGSENEYYRFIEVEGADYDFPVDVDAEMLANEVENISRSAKNLPPIDLMAQREAEMNGEEYVPTPIVRAETMSQRDNLIRERVAAVKQDVDTVVEAMETPVPARRTAAPAKPKVNADGEPRRRPTVAQHSRDTVGISERTTVSAESVLRAKAVNASARRLPSRGGAIPINDVPEVDPADDSAYTSNPERAERTSARTLQRQLEAAERNPA